MFETIVIAARDRERMAEVSAIAARFGLEALALQLGLSGKRGDDAAAADEQDADLPSRTRRALEALGPTYVKLGQILATRRDILGDAWIDAFARLQDDAPRLPFDDLRGQVEASLGAPPEEVFARFDTEPLAAASIAQVHRATLRDGTEVAVKIRRPGIRRRMEADMRLLRQLAGIVEIRSRTFRRFRPRAMIEQLGQELLDELDFTREGRNADLLRADLEGDTQVSVPVIHWQYSGPDLLVMDFIEGVPPRDPQVLREAGIDPDRIADLGARLVLDMVLVNGRFHADPHQGNLLCIAPDRLVLLDLGSVGTISPRRQHEFLTFILSLRAGNPSAVADMLERWSADAEVARERIDSAAERLVARHGNGPLVLNAMIADFFPLMRKEGLVLPPDLALMFKAMVTMDGVLTGIAPGFDLSQALTAMRGRIVAQRLAGLAAPEKMAAFMLEASRIADEAPRLMRAAAQRLEHGGKADQMTEDPAARSPALARAISRAGWLIGGAILVHAIAVVAAGVA